MRLLARPAPGASRQRLALGWALAREPAATAPADPAVPAAGSPASAPTSGWLPLEVLAPVAPALQALGLWSLDGPARRFDAEAWWYRLHFDAPGAGEATVPGANASAWVLGFDGLATLAEVWLNGQPVLACANMFRPHEVPVGGRLRERGNELLIRFGALDAALPRRRPRPRWRVPMIEQPQLRWWRATLLGRAPGWSPPAAVVGPWKAVWLEHRTGSTPRIAALALDSRVEGDTGHLALRVTMAGAPVASVRAELRRGDRVIGQALSAAHPPQSADAEADAARGADGGDAVDDDGLHFTGSVRVPDCDRWWPHTHGEPALYALRLAVVGADGAQQVHDLGDVGFRSVELDRSGGGFALRINGEPVFCRGACWTPLDVLRLHSDAPACAAALAQVRAAGMNMLRVAGTMVYENEAFLDACDAAGVMVWQDLMFANMDYPEDDAAFVAEVDAELAYQLTLWQARPAVVVVCGNSEVEQQAAMWGAARELWQPALFHEHIPGLVRRHLGDAVYWPSSAHGGAFPFQPSAGTSSYYGVGAYLRDPADARTSGLRFATECLAFAQIPSDAALERVAAAGAAAAGLASPAAALQIHQPAWKARVPRDLGAGWDFDDVRDHYVERLYGEPAESVRHATPARYRALGRAAVAELCVAAFTGWRAADSCCKGALVLWLRDLWAGAGWGLLDETGQPKSAFHALSRVLQPLHLGLIDDGLDGLSVHVVNERPQPLEATLALALYRHGEVPVGRGSRAIALAARSATRQAATDWFEGFADLTHAYRFGAPLCDVVVATLHDASGQRLAERVHFSPGPLAARTADIGLQARAQALADGRRRVTVRTRAAARAVHFDAPGWQADDEFFDLPPAGAHELHFAPLAGRARAWRAQVHAVNAREPAIVTEGAM